MKDRDDHRDREERREKKEKKDKKEKDEKKKKPKYAWHSADQATVSCWPCSWAGKPMVGLFLWFGYTHITHYLVVHPT